MSSIVEKPESLTPEQFLAHPERDRFELVHGRLVEQSHGSVAELDEDEVLEGEDVVPGFSVILSEILPPLNLEETL